MDCRSNEFSMLVEQGQQESSSSMKLLIITDKERELACAVNIHWKSFIRLYDMFTESGPNSYGNDTAFKIVWEAAERVLHSARAYAAYVPGARDVSRYGRYLGALVTIVRPNSLVSHTEQDSALMHYERIAASVANVMHQMRSERASFLSTNTITIEQYEQNPIRVESPIPQRSDSRGTVACALEERVIDLERIQDSLVEVAEYTSAVALLVDNQNSAVNRLECNARDAARRVDIARDSILNHYYNGGFSGGSGTIAALFQCRVLLIGLFTILALLVIFTTIN